MVLETESMAPYVESETPPFEVSLESSAPLNVDVHDEVPHSRM